MSYPDDVTITLPYACLDQILYALGWKLECDSENDYIEDMDYELSRAVSFEVVRRLAPYTDGEAIKHSFLGHIIDNHPKIMEGE